ncbi:MAG TPA: type I restriction endonuclease [Longimicrobiaceae bacterium]|nr:type I restriction endonuclease [Longimicrobiaceae bacterium]
MSTAAVHTERALEDAVEAALLDRGWIKGAPAAFDRERALDPTHLFPFIEDTQPKLWAELRAQHGVQLEGTFLSVLEKYLESHGTLGVLRQGIKFYGRKVELAYFRPAHGLNPEAAERYAKNRLVVTRQVKFIPGHEDSIDLVLFLNGLPVATVELKNEFTGQNVWDAVAQYKRRDPKHPIFRFAKRALVHFAVDPDLVYMTTRLVGDGTYFLPFNRGRDGGAGNPEHPSGYRSGYLWEEVWERHSLLDVLGRYMHLQREERWVDGQKQTKEILLFPRFHQLDAVRGLTETARAEGPGRSYLIQHSAGSGKTNSIAWLAHRLASLHDDEDRKVFDSVIVITDRVVLDRQLQDAIFQIEHKQGVVARIEQNSVQLADALSSGTPIIITTLQKFPFVTRRIGELPGRTYAVIVDEAHSSQTGESARHVREVLAPQSLEEAVGYGAEREGDDYEDRIVEVMRSRGRQPNLAFFAFTATPKGKTLEMFGRPGPDGKPEPFHLYTMRQAIEEGFILDVLQSYTTYAVFWRLAKTGEDDPELPKRKAAVSLVRFATLHPHNIAQKTEIIVEHFRAKVRPKIGGRAKAMVLTPSRLHAVRYLRAFRKYIAEKGYDDIHPLVAFSGTVFDPDTGQEDTEAGMNQIAETQLPEEFATERYNVLIVANKYQTGFDQPLLHTTYVDKRLAGVQAVQALSRLNRTHPGKDDTFVLDFVNAAEEIQAAFQPYYEQTSLAEQAEPHQLYELQTKLDAMQVYHASEVEAFAKVFYKPREKQTSADHALLYKHCGPAVDRFRALEPERKEEFRETLGAYVRLYAFLSQITPWQDADLEKLYSFGRLLLTRLPSEDGGAPPDLEGDVQLQYYRIQKTRDEETIQLLAGEGGTVKGPTAVGTRMAEEDEIPLSQIIDVLNERFGTNFTPEDQLFFEQITATARKDEEVVQRAHANAFDNFSLAIRQKIADFMIDRLTQNQDIVTKYFNESEFQEIAFRELAQRIYDDIRGEAA